MLTHPSSHIHHRMPLSYIYYIDSESSYSRDMCSLGGIITWQQILNALLQDTPPIKICCEVCLDILKSLLNVLGQVQALGQDAILRGLLLGLCHEIHLWGTDRVRLLWEEANNLIYHVLRVLVNYQQVILKTEVIRIIFIVLLVRLLLEPQVGVNKDFSHKVYIFPQVLLIIQSWGQVI